ncbi:AraC family transcriptional regulator [Pararhizobium sp. IMCC21322]|uniref:AraC family transcriptional regulator n=1 Tax=Pararhizobium sp. IMCC21322 TaxID=3067903 RepID=UPI0027417176|nr:AraC family transcriptional regulator [Pararhizobium sp. IMCC21322]
MLDHFAQTVLTYFDKNGSEAEPCLTDVPGLVALSNRKPTRLEGMLYNPVICLILQGRKETYIGDRKLSFGQGESLIVSHDLPVMAQITEASLTAPYIAVALSIDLQIIRSLYDQIDDLDDLQSQFCAMDAAKADNELVSAFGRLFELVDNPLEAKVMVPLVLREIHFRILLAKNGGMLRQLLMRDSHASRIGKAIDRIRQDFAAPLSVSELAHIAGMSTSSFHEHFKAITSSTPLQYQKDLRLLQARRLILEGDCTVSSTAFAVGYESPTQFSREYSRKFGIAPRSDRTNQQIAAQTA